MLPDRFFPDRFLGIFLKQDQVLFVEDAHRRVHADAHPAAQAREPADDVVVGLQLQVVAQELDAPRLLRARVEDYTFVALERLRARLAVRVRVDQANHAHVAVPRRPEHGVVLPLEVRVERARPVGEVVEHDNRVHYLDRLGTVLHIYESVGINSHSMCVFPTNMIGDLHAVMLDNILAFA